MPSAETAIKCLLCLFILVNLSKLGSLHVCTANMFLLCIKRAGDMMWSYLKLVLASYMCQNAFG